MSMVPAYTLMISMLGKNSSRQHLKYFLQKKKKGFDISCNTTPKETICEKYQTFFFWKKGKKNIHNLLSAEFLDLMIYPNLFNENPPVRYSAQK